jgi:hypothetical protein
VSSEIKVAAVFRSYAKSSDVVSEVVSRAQVSAAKASGVPGIDLVAFLVPSDHDCGETAQALSDAGVNAISASGYHSCGALNRAVETLQVADYTHVLFISNKAVNYLTEDAIATMRKAFSGKDNLGVIGMNIPELQGVQIVPIQNTFAMWDIAKLTEVGGFVSERDVEEVIPIARMLKRFYGAAFIDFDSGSLSIRESADGRSRHASVVSEKKERQVHDAEREGVTAGWIAMNVERISR